MDENFNLKPLKKTYFKDAMDHFREECDTEKIAFLYVSDDMEWGQKQLKSVQKKHQDLFFVGKHFSNGKLSTCFKTQFFI